MTRVDEFDAFYDGTRRHVLHLAYAFTGDLPAAAAATQDAYASAWQQWSKLRGGEPLEVVRPESMRLAALRHGAHLVRRKPPPQADTELIAALRGLSASARRMVLLQGIGDLDLPRAAREVGLTDEEGLRLTDASLTSLEESLRVPISEVERRLHALHAAADATPLPRASIIRRVGSRRQRRNTAMAVAACTGILLGGGYLVTAPVQPAQSSQPTPLPEASDATEPPPPPVPEVDGDSLLGVRNVAGFGGAYLWRKRATSDNLRDQDPLATCAQARFVSPRLLTGLTRVLTAEKKPGQRVVQTVEFTGSPEAAGRAYDGHLAWYAGCQQARLQLMESYRVRRAGDDTTILVLRRWTDPVVTMTIGVARTGSATTTVVHSAESRGVDIDSFARIMDAALGTLCVDADTPCAASPEPVAAPPPPTGEGAGFLGVIDLPPVGNVDKAWGGTEPLRWRPNPPATPCEAADFTRSPQPARSRDYVIPAADRIPLPFGISQTVATFGSGRAARRFVAATADTMRECDDNLGTRVGEPSTVRQGPTAATVWELSFRLRDDEPVVYRMGMVVNGDRVAQVTFSPVDDFDIGAAAYERLLLRAGQRLTELPDASPRR